MENLILAFAMSLDAFIVSFAYGLIIDGKKFSNAVRFGFAFGSFQYIMPFLGWNLTELVRSYLFTFSKIIVFSVFFVLAMKFLKDAFLKEEKPLINCVSLKCLLSLAIATSIDAFFAGVTINLNDQDIFVPALLIGLVTFMMAFTGYIIAGKIKNNRSKYLQITGALLLLYLAIKALI